MVSFHGNAQTVVTGIVKDATGIPLHQVNIVVKNSNAGTTTDANGQYRISKVGLSDTLVFSLVGFLSREVGVSGRQSIDVVLQKDVKMMNDVVIVGYGSQKKVNLTGAVDQVGSEYFENRPVPNIGRAMEGVIPNLNINYTSGRPTAAPAWNVRGLTSIGAGGEALILIDGVSADPRTLNPEDVASITVLKDAASAAIYGSQASNGVVLVTTKKGKRGAAGQITFDQYYGVQSVARKVDLLDATEYATILNEAAVNSGKNPYFTNAQIASMGSGTNWMDKMLVDNAATKNFSFGASGGSETSVYSSSLSYLGQEGVVGGKDLSNYERYNFRFNSEHKLYKDVLTFGQNLSFAYINKNGIGVGNQYNNSLRSAYQVSPLLPMYDANGNYYDSSPNNEPWLAGQANPYALMVYNNQNESNNQKLLGNVYLQIEPIKNLTFKTTLGLDYYAGEGHSYTPIYRLSIYANTAFDKVNQNMNKGKTLTWDNLLTYKFNVADNHHFETMVGTSSINFDGTTIDATNADSFFDDLEHAWLDNTTNKDGAKIAFKGIKQQTKRMSYFGRLNYNYKETYLLNATFRVDGSSIFSKENEWGYFPSVSGGWIVSNEEFLKDSKVLNFLKLRASWGQVGNQNARAFQYLSPIKVNNTNYSFGDEEGVLTPGAYPNRLSNLDLKWETSEQIDLGFDARFLNNALNLNVDFYKKTNKDWLILAPILATAGADAPFINGGDVVNKGVEVSLSYQNKIGDFNYSVSANGAYNKNTVGQIPAEGGIIHGLPNELYDNSSEFYRAQNGYPLGYFWGYKTGGVFQNQAQIDNYKSANGVVLQPTAAPGDIIYVNTNGDDKIDATDKTSIGNPNPDFTYGFSISANYKAFDFSLMANGVAGNQIVQSYRNQSNAYGNYTTAILDRWHGEGSSNTMPRVTEDNRNFTQFSDLYIHNGDFLRINTVTLGFDLAKMKQSKPFFASQFRVYFSVLNLYTFTKYNGMDPEIGFGSSNDDQKFSSGVDVGYYPRPRTFMMGLNVKL